jgi:hypothetical protein
VSGKLLIASAVALVVAAIVLWRFTMTDEAASAPRAGSAGKRSADDVAPAAPTIGPSAPRAGDKPVANPGKTTGDTSPRPTMTVSPNTTDTTPRRPDGVPIGLADRGQMQTAIVGTDPQINACIAQHGGKAINGTLMTTFIVARVKDKNGASRVGVETTGYEEDGSTITDPKLIECLHTSAMAAVLPQADVGVAVAAKRKIVIKNGDLEANYVYQHSYLP